MSPDSADGGRAFPDVEVRFPEIERWAPGNIGIPYVWSFDGPRPGPHAVVQGLTHGNEVCGAIAVDWALRRALRPSSRWETRSRKARCFASWKP